MFVLFCSEVPQVLVRSAVASGLQMWVVCFTVLLVMCCNSSLPDWGTGRACQIDTRRMDVVAVVLVSVVAELLFASGAERL